MSIPCKTETNDHTAKARSRLCVRNITCGHVGCIVGRRGIQVAGTVAQEECAVPHIEGHVAEGQQLKQQHGEVQDAHALKGCCRAVVQIVED